MIGMWLAWLAAAGLTPAQTSPTRASLVVTVVDSTGAVIVGAAVTMRPSGAVEPPGAVVTDTRGRASFEFDPGEYALEIEAAGFDRVVVDALMKPGRQERRVALPLAHVFEDVTVTTADRVRDGLNTILSGEQLRLLPDDPELLEAALREMAGPGEVTMAVDGFTGIPLPRPSEIQSIRFRRDEFSAEYHGRGSVRIDITTKPGVGPVHGVVGWALRNAALDARNAFVSERAPSRFDQHDLQVNGPIWRGRTSFRASLTTSRESAARPIFASTTGGVFASQIDQPVRQWTASGQLRHSLSGGHLFGAFIERTTSAKRNLGVGGFSLADRAYGVDQGAWTWAIAESGPLGRRLFSDLRARVRDETSVSSAVRAAPAIVVLDAFQTGGAQIAGGRSTRHLELTENVDVAIGARQAMRVGLELDRSRTRSDERLNDGGTFTFSGLPDFLAGRPAMFTRRDGDPLIDFTQSEIGWFVQDDIRLAPSWMVSVGVRGERQGHVSGWLNAAPRVGVTWASSGARSTNVYVGAGLFHDWLTPELYEQVLRVDGRRQWDEVILRPGYPNPDVAGEADVLQRSRFQLAPDLRLPRVGRVAARVRQRLAEAFELTASFSIERSASRLRGIDVNAPRPDGERPDPSFARITQIDSTARSLSRSLSLSLNSAIARVLSSTVTYQLGSAWNDSDDPFSLPADSRHPDADWGPSTLDVRHRVSGFLHASLSKTFRIDARFSVASAPPYTITTGLDDNHDIVFSDRPAGVARNSARGSAQRTVGARASWRLSVGPAATNPTPVVIQSGNSISAFAAAPGEARRFTIVMYLDAQNLLNSVNYVGYSGVETSPFFGRPTAALPPRQLQAGVQLVF